MSDITYLFIGGSHDGRRMAASGDRIVQLPEFEAPRQVFSEKMELRHTAKRTEIYRLETLRAGSRDIEALYVIESMSTEGALLLLVAKYKGRHL